ncbi:uncharacterized protein LOC106871895 isoform X2 [Octopus bimaculoides]|uniref:uncharacterized protein LOC106871895 isoform X2 n=1 Tax=Octopus bimaculoides TaxID=37653 RepID=UPI00071E47C8|nr:uncharacterized protein LOC106871895 isoform X2 [Octopus bimaculoides]|eukprot:XP_014774138.1 PREDICTED: uncharacterized protein LOC106871895 [Octopus bimaculoides]
MNTTALSIFLLLLLYNNGVLVCSKNCKTTCPEIRPRTKPRHNSIAMFSNISIIEECAKLCFYRSACNSFAFCLKNKICEIYFIVVNKFKEVDDYVFSFIKTWNPRLAGSCFNHSCESDEMCLPEENVYYCLKLDIDCGLPRQEKSAVINFQSRNSVEYSCLVNQSEQVKHSSYCKPTAIWSKSLIICGFSCKQPHLLNLTITSRAYVDSYWNYECVGMTTTCHMKAIWYNGMKNYFNISCTTKEDMGEGTITTNVSYLCARVGSKLVPDHEKMPVCITSAYIKNCDIICDIPNGKKLKDSTVRKCKKVYICDWLNSSLQIRKLVFCQPNIKMENGTISFEGVMKMVCEILDRLTLKTIQINAEHLLPDIRVGLRQILLVK